jgi:hypothetical protein
MFTLRKKCIMDKLLLEIKCKREEMIEAGLNYGFDSMETIRASQELDILIVKYQRCKEKVNQDFLAYALKKAASILPPSFRKARQPLVKSFITALMTSMLR